MKLTRRTLLGTGLGTVASAMTVGGSSYLYGTRYEMEWLELERITVTIEELGSGLDGFRIVLLSDFHLYPTTRLDFIRTVAATASGLEPDLLVLTGDFVQKDCEAIFDLAPVLASVDARHGSFCVLGNHDHWKGPDVVIEGLKSQGLKVLNNEGISISHNGSSFYLAGVDDTWSGTPDLSSAMDAYPGRGPAILLSHEPDPADEFSQDQRISLQLSGHSHGGQVRFPAIGSPFLPPYGRKYDMGLYKVRDMWLYTNRGIGVTAPIRLNCRPEITEVTLVPA